MEHNLLGLTEILVGSAFLALIAALAWYFTDRKDISDDSKMFR